MVQARVAAGWSLRPTRRVVSWNRAKQTAQASGSRAAQAIAPGSDQDSLVQDCVREVMRILREQGER
mgnify:CR=1 FL=1